MFQEATRPRSASEEIEATARAHAEDAVGESSHAGESSLAYSCALQQEASVHAPSVGVRGHVIEVKLCMLQCTRSQLAATR